MAGLVSASPDGRPALSTWKVNAFCAVLLAGLVALDWWTVRLNPSIVYMALLAIYVQMGGRRRSWGWSLALVGLIYGGYFFGARRTVFSPSELWHRSAFLNRTFVAVTVCVIALIARRRWGRAPEPALPEDRLAPANSPAIIGDDTLVAAVCFVFSLVIFLLDLMMPQPLNPAILYGVVVVLAGRTQSRSFVWALTSALLILTLVGLWVTPMGDSRSHVTFLYNRMVVAAVLLVLAAMVHLSLKERAVPSRAVAAKVHRILHVISGIHPGGGGPTAALVGFTQAQLRAGKEVTILSTWNTEEEVLSAVALRHLGAKVKLIGPALGPLRRHADLRRLTAQAVEQADVVHIHGLWEDIHHHACQAARRAGVPHILRPCGMLDPWSLAHHRLRKLIYMAWRLRRNLNHASAIHLTAPAECEAVAALGLSSPVIVEPLGIDLREFDPLPLPGGFRGRYPELRDRPCIIFFGRVCEKKGVHRLIEAMSSLKDRRAMLLIAGPVTPEYQRRLDRLIERFQLARRIAFVGILKGAQRVAALADSDLFVLPSSQENFGIAVVEALAAGCPAIVSSQVATVREIVEWKAGDVAPLDPVGLAAVMDEWLADPERCRQAGNRGRTQVFNHFNWEAVEKGWEDHYQHLSNLARARANVPAGGHPVSSPVPAQTPVEAQPRSLRA